MATYNKHRYPGIRPAKQLGTWTIDYKDHLGRRRQISFKGTEADAAKRRRDILSEVDKIKHGLKAAPEKRAAVPILSNLWRAFEEDRRLKIDAGSMDDKTLIRCRCSYRNLIDYDTSLEHRQIDKIKSKDLEGFKAYRREKGCAPEGVNVDLRKLKTLFNFAVKKGLLETSPLAEVSFVTVPKSDVRFLNGDELRSLQSAMDRIDSANAFQRDAKDLVLFYLHTGARASEALYPTFTWEYDGQNAIRFPRTKQGKTRTIPKVDAVKAVLESRKHIPDGPFHLDKDQVYKRVKWLMGEAGISDASTHTLRKTAGAWYYMATKDIFATSKFLGHSTVVVTEQHYAGLIQSLQVEYARQFETALNLQLACNFRGNGGYSRVNKQEAFSTVSTN
ncbi:MAG: site-specific integrase [Fidelibacterota bacterium]|nr:MAG: site-specific integrase [Candidatus Neomarinimicrobiota bacterium]